MASMVPTGDEKEVPDVEQHPEVQCSELQPAAKLVLEIGFSDLCLTNVETKTDDIPILDSDVALVADEQKVQASESLEQCQASIDLEAKVLKSVEQCCPMEKSLPQIESSAPVGPVNVDTEPNQQENFSESSSREDQCSRLQLSSPTDSSTPEIDYCLILEQCHSRIEVDCSMSPDQSTFSPKVRTVIQPHENNLMKLEDRELTEESSYELPSESSNIEQQQANIEPVLQKISLVHPESRQPSVMPESQDDSFTHSLSPRQCEDFLLESGLESQKQCKATVPTIPAENKSDLELPEQAQLSIQSERKILELNQSHACFAHEHHSSPEVHSLKEQLGRGFIQEPDPAQGRELAIKQPETVCRGLNEGNSVDSVKKEPVPDISNMEVVLPVESDTKVQEADSKVNLDATDIQQISTDDLEYVVDPSINVVLQEFVPEGLEDEMSVYIVNSDDVETDVSSVLEAAETTEAGISEQTGASIDSDLNRPSEVTSEAKRADKGESESVSVVVRSSPMRQSPQRTIATPSSVVASPRSAGRPSKGSMVARKLVMDEQEATEKSELVISAAEGTQQTSDSETLSREALENASVLLVQENGQLVNLSESGQATNIIDDIHVIQDSSNSSVVVVHHDGILKDTEMDCNDSSQSTSDNTHPCNVAREVPRASSTETVDQDTEHKSPAKSPRKLSDKKESVDASPMDKIDDSKCREEPRQNSSIDNLAIQGAREEKSQLQEEIKMKESEVQEELVKKAEETKEEKATPKVDDSYENMLDDNGVKHDVAEDSSKYHEQSNEKIASKEKRGPSTQYLTEEEESKSIDSEVVATRTTDEKGNRAETPSTEDDNTRDVEPPPPVKRGRGRHPRAESATYSDSVPSSPASSSVGHDDEKEHKAWKKSIMLVYNRIAAHKNASIFLKPITDDKAPNYTSLIYRPQDLQTIKKNIEDKKIRTTDEFQRDILLMFNNAIMYNKTDTAVHDMAREMQEEGVGHLNEYRNTQMLVNTGGAEISHLPPRGTRGTRTADKREQDVDGFSSRRGLPGRSNPSRTGAYTPGILGKRKRSLPDDQKVTPKRRKEDD